jgi:type VI secretion system protein ImpL
VVLVAGVDGSCKTTIVVNAGIDAELLAGDAPAAGAHEPPPPTPAANVWAVRQGVLVESGGTVFGDEARWKRLVRAIRAPRLGALLGRGAPPPRALVLCVSCDLLYAGDAGAQLDALAQVTRERLAAAARELGVALPVYVVFTKADRIPEFEPWVAPLTREEVRFPLGAALRFDATLADTRAAARAAATGSYAERLMPRLEAAFADIVSAMAGRRLELLGRESQIDRRLAAYELPREMQKLSAIAERFLVEICRPMQIGVSPQLR